MDTGTRTDTPAASASATGPGRIVAAPRLTRTAALVIVFGVVAQAALAGGFLAGRPGLRGLHEHFGHALVAVGIVVLVAGLIGRRSRRESNAVVGTRIALVLALALTVVAGMRASRGASDLLVLHLPLAFAIAGLAARLLIIGTARRS